MGRIGKLTFLGLLIYPSVASADVVVPTLYLESRISTWWAVSFGLLLAFLFIWRAFGLDFRTTILVDPAATYASTVVGLVAVPIADVALEVFSWPVFYHVFRVGTFNSVTWVSTFLMAVFISAAIE